MYWLIKKIFIRLLPGIVSSSNHTKYVPLSNQKCDIQPNRINLHPNEYGQEFHYYPFVVTLDRLILSMAYLTKYVFQTKQKI